MLRLVCIIICYLAITDADIMDLEALIKELEQQPAPVPALVLPKLQPQVSSYKPAVANNIFDATRASSDIGNNSYTQDYNLIQLQMVGYMRYTNTDYAFLRTPYETIKVKVGDLIKGGKVTKITQLTTEVDVLQIIDDKSYNKKIFIDLIVMDANKAKLNMK